MNHNYKSLILTLVKEENKYLKEWIDHYKKLNITKILLIDNNDIDGENIYDVIDKNDPFIDVINMKGYYVDYGNVGNILKRIYLYYYTQYDYVCLFDCDEFLMLNKKYNNDINNYLNEEWFDYSECVILHQKNFTSNGLTYYDDRPLEERFTETTEYRIKQKGIINCNLVKDNFNVYIKNYIIVNDYYSNDGNFINPKRELNYENRYACAWLNHYCVKSAEEYINKCLKNKAYYSMYNTINTYRKFNNNKISDEQLNYVARYLKDK